MMDEEILLSYGSGGKLTHMLLNEIVLPAFANPILKNARMQPLSPCAGGAPLPRTLSLSSRYSFQEAI